eukprot:PhF_6_TR13665/c0_g1_i1/m.21945
MPPKPGGKKDDKDDASKVVVPPKHVVDVDAIISNVWKEAQKEHITNPTTIITTEVLQRFFRSYNFSMEIENAILYKSNVLVPTTSTIVVPPPGGAAGGGGRAPTTTPTPPPNMAMASPVAPTSPTMLSPSGPTDRGSLTTRLADIDATLVEAAGDTLPMTGIDYVALDARVVSLPPIPNNTPIDDLLQTLCSEFLTPSWRQSASQCGHKILRTIFRWITNNVVYDVKGAVEAEQALSTRKADSCGFAKLFEFLSNHKLVNQVVEGCVVVQGFTRRGVDASGAPEGLAPWSWNIITIDGKLYLVDACMATTTAASTGTIENFYWATPPVKFLGLHYPSDDTAQLLHPTCTKHQWEVRPVVGHVFYNHGLQLVSHKSRMMVVCKAPPIHLTFGCSLPDVDLHLTLRAGSCASLTPSPTDPSGLQKGYVWQSRQEHTQSTTFALTFPQVGLHAIDVFARRGGAKAPWQLAVRYQVQMGSVLSQDPLFPIQHMALSVAKVHEPMAGKIIVNQEQSFVVVPTTHQVVAVCVVNRIYSSVGRSASTAQDATPNDSPSESPVPSKPTTPAVPSKPTISSGGVTSPSPGSSPSVSVPAGPPKPEVISATAHLLEFSPREASFKGTIKPQLGLCDVYVRVGNAWEIACEGIQVVKTISQKELSFNGGKPLMMVPNMEKDTPFIHRMLCKASMDTMSVIAQTATVKKVGSYFENKNAL